MSNPFIELVGAELVEQLPGQCLWRLDRRECHGNPHGSLHGGVISTLLDVACAYSGAIPLVPLKAVEANQRPATLSLTLQFLAKAKGNSFVAKGRRTGGGKRIFFAEAQLFSDDGTLVAMAMGSFCMQQADGLHATGEPANFDSI
ncbi:hypothetical protein HMEPL2_29680 [Vreelandella aquamarina]|jgi:uncharacterized protein (TIGR00369 family)|uniref:Thioesterase domain-containing protein n=1 Tax=Vreelandella aquamarina TaxID=77097 RepID=A0A6F8XGY5_9GAMM|nr:PaaI family thioesterase [Halomonas meridiana]BCB72617.1 hypothetical protein HMEPL2_29680 [Halomonas meridiana]